MQIIVFMRKENDESKIFEKQKKIKLIKNVSNKTIRK